MKWLCVTVGLLAIVTLLAGVGYAGSAKTTLVVALNQDPDILDPSLSRTYVGRIIYEHMCEKLYEIDENLKIFHWEDYYSFGFVQETLNNYLSAYKATGQQRLLDETRHWAAVQSRLIQPTGSWTWSDYRGEFNNEVWSPFINASSFFGRSTMDHNAAPYVNFFGRLRKLTGDDRHRDAELKGARWLMHNSLRTGYWEHQQQQSDGADSHLANVMAIESLDYLLESAPATVTSVALAEDLRVTSRTAGSSGGRSVPFTAGISSISTSCRWP